MCEAYIIAFILGWLQNKTEKFLTILETEHKCGYWSIFFNNRTRTLNVS